MGLDDRPLAAVRSLLEDARRDGRARVLEPPGATPATAEGDGRAPILRAEAAVELGAPAAPSAVLLLCDEDPARTAAGRVTLVGPDLDGPALSGERGALGLVIAVGAEPALEPLRRATELRDALYAVRRPGLMLRWLPSQGRLWLRVSRLAHEAGVRCAFVGHALAAAVAALPWARGVEVTLLTEAAAVMALAPALEESLAVLAALRRMQEQPAMDCASCDSAAVCAAIEELRQVHERLARSSR
jgi:CO dehydrogenase/acetyl-CoA synthase beta subunit